MLLSDAVVVGWIWFSRRGSNHRWLQRVVGTDQGSVAVWPTHSPTLSVLGDVSFSTWSATSR